MRTAAALLLTLAACTSTPTAQPPVSGTASMRPVQSVPDIDPAPRQATTTTVPPTTTTTAPPVVAATASEPVRADMGILARIAECESGGSYTARNPTSSASGKYQFLTSTWTAWGDTRWATAADAPPEVQEAAARRLFAAMGTQPWVASRHCWSN